MKKLLIFIILPLLLSCIGCEQVKREVHTYEITLQSGEKDTVEAVSPWLDRGDFETYSFEEGFHITIYSGVRSFKQIK